MVPDKFNMVDMEGIDILFSYGDIIPGLYQKLVESIAQCRYQCLYNWYFDGVLIPPTYVEMTVNQDTNDVWINGAVFVTSGDRMLVHLPSIETVSGAIVNITHALPRAVEELICYINPTQSGSGDPSPSNIRLINGWARLNIYNEETYDASATPELIVNWQDTAGTIYGGTVTLNEDGSADVVSNYVVYNILPSQWTWYSSSHCFAINRSALSPLYKVFGNNVDNRIADVVSSKYKPNTFNNIANSRNSPDYSVAIREYSTSWLAVRTNGTENVLPEECQIKLPLATPITYHFDNIGQLYTRLGTNVIWHDANGDISVTYWKE